MEQGLFSFLEDLTCSQEERPAKTSVSQANAQVAKKEAAPEALSVGSGCAWYPNWVRELSCGKMSLGHFQATTDETSTNSFEKLLTSGIAYHDEFLTLNTHEWTSGPWPSRNAGVVCGLSDVLQTMSPKLQKYFLSTEALSGILRRAESRGKKLPELLKTAIRYMLQWWKMGA